MLEGLAKDRKRVIGYWQKNPIPMVNYKLVSYPKIASLGELLSTNTYQKGGWVLHMLHNELGDDDFWKSVRQYYAKHKNGVASTADLQRVFEEESGKNLQQFFQQWVYGLGQPVLDGEWSYKNRKLEILITQNQQKPFEFPLELGFYVGDEMTIETVNITSSMQIIDFGGMEPDAVIVDPNVHLLYEGSEELIKVDAVNKAINTNILNDIWVLTEINGEHLMGNKAPTMELHLKDQRVIGNAGCNNYQGGFKVESGGLQFDKNVASTRMMCENISVEDSFLKAIAGAVYRYEVRNNRLYLLQEGKSVLVFKKVD
jgi:heat shock protein HslJ